ncbi:MAG: alpha/beta hydrolase [Polyangiaceae bacterium]|nr:alpha/beta hydrolase [Burkholderiaceae bacterium]NUQ75630.1 alpha/beta hydrolase [Polyangiaceae bacterium]
MSALQPRFGSVRCLSPAGLHSMAYTEWGEPANPRVLICVHGLTRVGRDFDRLARALADRYRVVCPDVVGRGRSDWLRDPQHYHVAQYVADMVTLIARLGVESVHWVGTSMGGLIGIMLAGQPGSPIAKLVINDVGPTLDAAALARIGEYLGKPVRFTDLEQAVDYIAAISAPFGLRTRDEWREITETVVRPIRDQQGDGWVLHYDPRVAVPFRAVTPESAAAGEAAMWKLYDAIACPTLLVRGEFSDLLTRETARAMTQRGPRAKLVEIAGVGHAPMFMHDGQIAVVRDFLLGG